MNTLIKADLGCNIGSIYYGTVFYADDIMLLGASVMKVQQMLNIYYTYCYKYGIYLNSAKSKWMCTDVQGWGVTKYKYFVIVFRYFL